MNSIGRLCAWLARLFSKRQPGDGIARMLDGARLSLHDISADLETAEQAVAQAEAGLEAAMQQERPEHELRRLNAVVQAARAELESHDRRWKAVFANIELLADQSRLVRERRDSELIAGAEAACDCARDLYVNTVQQRHALDEAQIAREASQEALKSLDELFAAPVPSGKVREPELPVAEVVTPPAAREAQIAG